MVQDIAKQVPEALMAAGCSVSLHVGFLSYCRDESETVHTDYQRVEPFLFLPGNIHKNAKVTFKRENDFTAGKITIWAECGNCVVLADGATIYNGNGEPSSEGDFICVVDPAFPN